MLSVNFTNCFVDSIGISHGLIEHEWLGLEPRLKDAYQSIMQQATAGKLGFVDLPNNTEEARKIMSWARKSRILRHSGGPGNWRECARHYCPAASLASDLLEPGRPEGSQGVAETFRVRQRGPALGRGPRRRPRPQKDSLQRHLQVGTTAESLAAYFIFRKAVEDKVGAKKASRHFVITTDAQKGYLRELADREKMDSFVVPANVGGRFSVLTPVGLVPAALTGVDLVGLLNGAKAMRTRCQGGLLRQDPAAAYASLQYLFYQKGMKLSVLMPYSQNLYSVADWYRQLWAESLGKKLDRNGRTVNAGPTPIKALGVTDQHSQAQLYMEGPYDKVITILSVQDFGKKALIPEWTRVTILAAGL